MTLQDRCFCFMKAKQLNSVDIHVILNIESSMSMSTSLTSSYLNSGRQNSPGP